MWTLKAGTGHGTYCGYCRSAKVTVLNHLVHCKYVLPSIKARVTESNKTKESPTKPQSYHTYDHFSNQDPPPHFAFYSPPVAGPSHLQQSPALAFFNQAQAAQYPPMLAIPPHVASQQSAESSCTGTPNSTLYPLISMSLNLSHLSPLIF